MSLNPRRARLEIPANPAVPGPPNGPAGGDLGGTYPNPSVQKVQGVTPGAGGLAILDDASVAAIRATLGIDNLIASSQQCEAGAAVGDLVYFRAATVQFERARANAAATMPAFGIVIAKPTPVTCDVMALDGVYDEITVDDTGAPLVPGTIYFVSPTVAGKVTSTAIGPGQFAQEVGQAIATNIMLVALDDDYDALA